MIDDVSSLRVLARLLATPLPQGADQGADLPWAPGARVEAHVLGMLPGGRFRVEIDRILLDVNLPEGTAPGERLALTVVALPPRLTFALEAARSATPAAISDGGRNLAALLDAIDGQPVAPQPVAPLLPPSQSAPAKAAEALKEALDKSGLFYESHQAQWVAGERPLQELLHEPQGKLSPVVGERALSEIGGAAALPVHPDAVGVVQQQLEALDLRQIVWRGVLWPGETVEWRVDEHPATSADDLRAWRTTVTVGLPMLGEVTAEILLAGDQVRVKLRADAAAGSILGAQASELENGLADAGLRLSSFRLESAAAK